MCANPTTKVATFDGTLDGFTGVDPIRYNGGLWLEEADTNYAADPSAEGVSLAAQWAKWTAAGTMTQDATEAASGSKSVKYVSANAGANEGIGGTTNVSLGWTGAATVIPITVDVKGGGTLTRCFVRVYYTDASTADSTTNTNVVLSSSWQTLTFSITLNPAKTVNFIQVLLLRSTAGAFTLYADKLFIPNKPYLTSYLDGNLGAGYTHLGTPNQSASTRAASSASIATAGHLDPASGAIACRISPTIETGLEEIWGECGTKGAGTDHMQWGRDATKHPFVEWSSNDAAYQRLTASETIDAGTERFLYLGWDGVQTWLQVDDTAINVGTRAAPTGSLGAGNLILEAL